MEEFSSPTMFNSYSSISPSHFLDAFDQMMNTNSPFNFDFSSPSTQLVKDSIEEKNKKSDCQTDLKKKRKSLPQLQISIPDSNFNNFQKPKEDSVSKKKTVLSKKEEKEVIEEINHQTNGWQILEKKEDINFDIEVLFNYRGLESMSNKIDEQLYRPIKYELIHTFKGKDNFNTKKDFILIKIQIVDDETNEEILKNGNKIISVSESAFTKNKEGIFENQKMKFNFLDCSYHNENRRFSFKVSYYLNNNLKNPFLVKKSNSFLVYARKKQEKRKLDDFESNQDLKKKKSFIIENDEINQSLSLNSDLNLFENKLKELLNIYPNLNQNDKNTAKTLILNYFSKK
eukprot:gene11143-3965_t